jgi:hypothetical protein
MARIAFVAARTNQANSRRAAVGRTAKGDCNWKAKPISARVACRHPTEPTPSLARCCRPTKTRSPASSNAVIPGAKRNCLPLESAPLAFNGIQTTPFDHMEVPAVRCFDSQRTADCSEAEEALKCNHENTTSATFNRPPIIPIIEHERSVLPRGK